MKVAYYCVQISRKHWIKLIIHSYQIKKIILKLVHTDQTAYVKGRNICESIRIIDVFLEHADRENENGILLCADIEKALD